MRGELHVLPRQFRIRINLHKRTFGGLQHPNFTGRRLNHNLPGLHKRNETTETIESYAYQETPVPLRFSRAGTFDSHHW